MQRSLLIFSPFFPPHIGGLESHVYEFAKLIFISSSIIVRITEVISLKKRGREQEYFLINSVYFFLLVKTYIVKKEIKKWSLSYS